MSRPKQEKCYLGDAVYVQQENGMLKLTTEDGISTTNAIYLEPETLANFLTYLRSTGIKA